MKESDCTGGEGALQEGLGEFLRQVAEFIKAQCFDMLHYVVGEIDLHGCFQQLMDNSRRQSLDDGHSIGINVAGGRLDFLRFSMS